MPQITLLTGPERRRRWVDAERRRILAAAFASGAVVAAVSRRFEVSSSLIYKWRRQALASAICVSSPTGAGAAVGFAPAVMLAAAAAAGAAPPDTPAILVELPNGTRLRIGSQASAALVTATLRALR